MSRLNGRGLDLFDGDGEGAVEWKAPRRGCEDGVCLLTGLVEGFRQRRGDAAAAEVCLDEGVEVLGGAQV
jgi:hypothetical protein